MRPESDTVRDVVIVCGFSRPALVSLQAMRPQGSVVLVEEPDIVRKRDVEAALGEFPVVGALLAIEHHDWRTAERAYDAARASRVASVVPVVEYATPFAARLAELHGLPGATLEAALSMRDKHRLRRVTGAHGVRNPRSLLVETLEEARGAVAAIGGPVILKPADRQGSVGAVVLRDPAGLDRAWAASQQRDEGALAPDRAPSARTLVEELVEGPEFSVEALVREGRILFANVTAKELFPGPFPVERAHVVPAPLPAAETERLVAATARVVEATGFDTGIVHCEWIRAVEGPTLVECAGRFAGDGIIDLVCRAWGFDIVAAYQALMRGEDPGALPTQPAKTASVRFLGGRDGVLADLAVDPAAVSREGVVAHFLMAKPGDRTVTPAMSWHRLASVIVEAADAEAARALAESALAGIRPIYVEEAAA